MIKIPNVGFTFLQSVLLTSLLLAPVIVQAKSGLQQFSQLSRAGLLIEDVHGNPIRQRHEDRAYIPASTTKLVTAWLALTHWGENYRFKTNFYWEPQSKTLSVKGSGDPFLVSEEIKLIANRLKQRGIRQINAIVLDNSLFEPSLIMPGTGRSNNPYDAIPSALSVNFNTVYVKKVRGVVRSAEQQTPLTSFARKMGKRFKKGKLRVNTGRNPRDAEMYFAEILRAFLHVKSAKLVSGLVPQQAPIYIHSNSKTLGEMIKPMLKYSTNFIANQLILKMSQEEYRRPANARDVEAYMHMRLSQQFPHWRNFTLRDGAGLSRDNRLSPRQLVELLKKFKKWKSLLPEIETDVFAKSGTLNRVSTLAGYVRDEPFALMMNQSVPRHLRNKIARELARL